jgi:hypothetical protein
MVNRKGLGRKVSWPKYGDGTLQYSPVCNFINTLFVFLYLLHTERRTDVLKPAEALKNFYVVVFRQKNV